MSANLRAFFLWSRVSITPEGYLKTHHCLLYVWIVCQFHTWGSILLRLAGDFFMQHPDPMPFNALFLIAELFPNYPLMLGMTSGNTPGPPICSIDYIALILAATAGAFKGSVTGCDCWHGCVVTSHLDHLGLLYTATSRHGHTHTTRVGWLL